MKYFFNLIFFISMNVAIGQTLKLDIKMVNNISKTLHNTPLILETGYWQTFGFQFGYIQHFKHFNLSVAFIKSRPKTFFGFEDKSIGYYTASGFELHDCFSPSIGIGKRLEITSWLYVEANFACHYTSMNLTSSKIIYESGVDEILNYQSIIHSKENTKQFRYEIGGEVGFRFFKRWNYHFNASYIYGNKKYIEAELNYNILNGPEIGQYNNQIISDGKTWTLGMGVGFDIIKMK